MRGKGMRNPVTESGQAMSETQTGTISRLSERLSALKERL
jgi:hypothetical protein